MTAMVMVTVKGMECESVWVDALSFKSDESDGSISRDACESVTTTSCHNNMAPWSQPNLEIRVCPVPRPRVAHFHHAGSPSLYGRFSPQSAAQDKGTLWRGFLLLVRRFLYRRLASFILIPIDESSLLTKQSFAGLS